jgi:hypothetical protein
MDLTVDNKIENKNKVDNEINSFINELGKSLEKNTDFQTTFANEVFDEMPLAKKYKNQLEDIINKCFEEMSYEDDFFYFDYDSKGETYYLDYYSDGVITREEIPENEVKDSNLEKGWFYDWYDDDRIVEANSSIKEGIKISIDSELDLLDFNKNK